jgi:hypothetical protein
MCNTRLTLIAMGFAAAAPLLPAQNVTTTVYDYNGATQLLMRSDDYGTSGYATYTTQTNGGKTTILSAILSDGSWRLDLYGQSTHTLERTLWITPNDPVGSEPAGPPPNYYWQNVEVYSHCFDQTNNNVPYPNLVNGSNNCSLGVDFNYNNLVYKLVMTPNLPGPGPASGLVSVACNKVSSNQCVDWTITPNAAAPSPNVSNLYYYSSSKGSATWIFVGQYYNNFLIHVTNP